MLLSVTKLHSTNLDIERVEQVTFELFINPKNKCHDTSENNLTMASLINAFVQSQLADTERDKLL